MTFVKLTPDAFDILLAVSTNTAGELIQDLCAYADFGYENKRHPDNELYNALCRALVLMTDTEKGSGDSEDE